MVDNPSPVAAEDAPVSLPRRGVFEAPHNPQRDRSIRMLAAAAALAVIWAGFRFLASPEIASAAFGMGARPGGYQMHTVLALRELWLGALALAMVWLGEWRLLTLWLAGGALVSFGDAGVVIGDPMSLVGRTGLMRLQSVLLHLLSGLALTVLAILAWRRVRRDRASG